MDWSPDGLEKALQAVSSHLLDKAAGTAAGTMGWVFLIALKVNMGNALHDAAHVHELWRQEEELGHCIHMLEQEMCGSEEPSASD